MFASSRPLCHAHVGKGCHSAPLIRGSLHVTRFACLPRWKRKNVKNCQAHQKSNAYQSLLKVIECLLKCFCFFRSAKESSNVNEMDHPSSQIDLISLKNGNCGFHIFQNVISRDDWKLRHVSGADLIDDCRLINVTRWRSLSWQQLSWRSEARLLNCQDRGQPGLYTQMHNFHV